MKPKILIGCVTYFKQEHVLEKLIESLRRLRGVGTEFDYDLIFIDNSPGKSYYNKLQDTLGKAGLPGLAMVGYDTPKDKSRIDKIITGRALIRHHFLQNKKYTHVFFLDTDVIMPPETISKLLSHDKQLVAGLYLASQKLPNGKIDTFPVGCVHHSEGKIKQLTIPEVWEPQLMEAKITGLGCVLVRRDVLEKIGFRNIGDSTIGGEDTAFFLDARAQGFPLFLDTTIRCDHYFYPMGDKRNMPFMFSRYRRNDDPVEASYAFDVKMG